MMINTLKVFEELKESLDASAAQKMDKCEFIKPSSLNYALGDRAIRSLPKLLQQKYALTVTTPLVRKFIRHNDLSEEVNIFGEVQKEGQTLSLIGEAKTQLSARHIEQFRKRLQRLEKVPGIKKDTFLLMVTYSAEPEVEEEARKYGIEVIWSFEL